MDFQATSSELSLLSALYSAYPKAILYNPVPDAAKRLHSSGLISSVAPADAAFDLSYPGAYLSITDAGVSFYLSHKRNRRAKIADWVRYAITTLIAVSALAISIISLLLQQKE